MSTDVDPLLGSIVAGRYAISRCIGRGGMGAVYLARQHPLGRDVALKVIRADLVHDPEVALRFEREARAIARLTDPHIVVVHDFGQSDSMLFLAMELLTGTPLGERLRTTGALPLRQALRITRDICVALDVAHENGVIHRDLKPDNIMLVKADGRDDYAKVLDFGIAKIVGGPDGTLTASRVVLGTPGYVAPEVIMNGMTDDPRTDLYAVGVMLFEMLAGRSPFVATTPSAVLVAQAGTDAPLVSSLVQGLPDAVVSLVGRLTARRPEGRPANARAVIDEIDGLGAFAGPVTGVTTGAIDPRLWSSTGPSTAILGTLTMPPPSHTQPLSSLAGGVATPLTSTSLASEPALVPATVAPKKTVSRGLMAAAAAMVVLVAAVVMARTSTPTSTSTPAVVAPVPVTAIAVAPPAPLPAPVAVAVAPPVVDVAPPAMPAVIEPAAAPPKPALKPSPKPLKPAADVVVAVPAGPPALTSALVKQAITQSVGKASACTNTNIKLAQSGPGLFIDHCPSYKTLDGARQVSLTVAPDGSVLAARFTDAATNDHRLGACVLKSLLAWKLLPFAGNEPVEITQRVTFEPCVPINGKCVF